MANTNYKYHLEKYSGRNSRYQCPQCGDMHSFSRYVDESGNYLNDAVGRCDHESGCGYHYTPKEFFANNPQLQQEPGSKAHSGTVIQSRQPQPKVLHTIPFSYVERSASNITNKESELMCFLSSIFDQGTIWYLQNRYCIGATKDRDVIYWQIDVHGRVRTGKVMKYDPNTGHRIKSGNGVNWIHSLMKKQKQLPDDWELSQCLFGEHLLNTHGNEKKCVAVVESEKTALIGAAVMPQWVWLATGGKSQMSVEKMQVLRGRTVTLFPDVDGFNEWQEKAEQFTSMFKVEVSRFLQDKATPEQRDAKVDIADLILSQLTQERHKREQQPQHKPTEENNLLREFASMNSELEYLIATFNLTVVA